MIMILVIMAITLIMQYFFVVLLHPSCIITSIPHKNRIKQTWRLKPEALFVSPNLQKVKRKEQNGGDLTYTAVQQLKEVLRGVMDHGWGLLPVNILGERWMEPGMM